MTTTDIYTRIPIHEFVKAVQQYYFYRVYSLRIRTEASGFEPHTVIPYKVIVQLIGSDAFITFGDEPYLDMENFVYMFHGIPLITISSDDFINDEDTKQVESWSSYINIDINIAESIMDNEYTWILMNPHKPYDVKSAMYCEDKSMKPIQKGRNIMRLYQIFREELNRRQ